MKSSRILFAIIAGFSIAFAAPVLAQDPHAHDSAPKAQPAAPANCPMAGGGMSGQAMNGSGNGAMQQGMMGGEHMQQMMQMMQQMHTQMQEMHDEMMQMRQDMQRRRGK